MERGQLNGLLQCPGHGGDAVGRAPAMTAIFPWAVAVLELGAGVVYLCAGQWRLAVLWLGYGVAAMALAGVR